jgi:hypothetical protein
MLLSMSCELLLLLERENNGRLRSGDDVRSGIVNEGIVMLGFVGDVLGVVLEIASVDLNDKKREMKNCLGCWK